MVIDIAGEPGAAERVGGRAVQLDHDARGRFGGRPWNKKPRLALLHAAAGLTNDKGAAVEQGDAGLAHDILR